MATAREFLTSIISRCAELQNWSDSDLNFNERELQEADRLLDNTITEEEINREEALVRQPKPPRATFQGDDNFPC